MYIRRVLPRLAGVVVVMFWAGAASVDAQSSPPAPSPEQHEPEAPQTAGEHAGHDMGSMAREGSGTAWLPDSSPMYAIHTQKGAWMLMAHENAFLQYLHESGNRGEDQLGSINWIMGMAGRNAGTGHVELRGMFSVEPWTIRGCGYPDLLASGEQCLGEKIHDRQHPHDLAMEIAAEFDAPVAGTVRWQVYGGPAGEPALGPVAYPHRISAMPNPLAPMTHHWLDSTHISFGVFTGGVYGKRWKAETSVFNGREPDDKRTNFDFGALDSYSGRLWFLPTANLAFQVSAGRLTQAEAGERGGARIDVTKATASATYSALREHSIWATTVAWGANAETGHATNALLVETNLTLDDRNTWFGRFETAGKTAHDLDVATASDASTVAKLQGGYTRYLQARGGLTPGLGATLSAGLVPGELEAAYGSRVNVGAGVFLTLRPAAPAAGAAISAGAGHTMVMTATDPAKLMCSTPVDATTASRTTYNGTAYYFCSDTDRDQFLKDPAMNVAMMPKP